MSKTLEELLEPFVFKSAGKVNIVDAIKVAKRYALEQQIQLLKRIEKDCPTIPDAYYMMINDRVELEKQLKQLEDGTEPNT